MDFSPVTIQELGQHGYDDDAIRRFLYRPFHLMGGMPSLAQAIRDHHRSLLLTCPAHVEAARVGQPQSRFLNLPVELQLGIIDMCDLQTHTRLRRTCRQLRLLATSQTAFRHIAQFGMTTLETLLQTKNAPQVTAKQLWPALQRPWCEMPGCGEPVHEALAWDEDSPPRLQVPEAVLPLQPQPQFAPYLVLPSLLRCCLRCITRRTHQNMSGTIIRGDVARLHQGRFVPEKAMCCQACQLYGNSRERAQAFTAAGLQYHVRFCWQVVVYLREILRDQEESETETETETESEG